MSKIDVNIPQLFCTARIERYCPKDKSLAGSRLIAEAVITLGRNEFNDIVVKLDDRRKCAQEVNRFVVMKTMGHNYRLNTKFAFEGKSSIALIDSNVCIFVSNCPPNQLSLFLKCFVFKCDYYNRDEKQMAGEDVRRRLLSTKSPLFDKISPLTDKDIKRNVLLKSNKDNIPLKTAFGESPKSTKTFGRVLAKRPFLTNDENRPPDKRQTMMSLIPSPVRQIRLLNENTLTSEQKRVIEIVTNRSNVFFTGSAGTGKSHLLKFIISRLPPETTFVTASTGIAASHISGMTLHMFSGVTPDQSRTASAEECAAKIRANSCKANKWQKCKCLVIDEISMVCGKYFQLIDTVAKIVRNCGKPFGGIQLVICGDFLQLPPITRRGEEKCFAFQTDSWTQCIKHSVVLTQVKRQTDQTFVKLLQNIRIGKCDEFMRNQIQNTVYNDLKSRQLCPTRLFTHRNDVELMNTRQLEKIDGKAYVFTAQDSDRKFEALFDTMCPTSRVLELKVGAQVMLNRNIDVCRGLVNGLNGKVVSFERTAKHDVYYPKIQFINGCQKVIKPESWLIRLATEKYATRLHLPLQLSWALSIHKCQGMTIDNTVEISLARVFESGQAYVALSRCKSLDSIKVLDFSENSVVVDSTALQFYKDNNFC